MPIRHVLGMLTASLVLVLSIAYEVSEYTARTTTERIGDKLSARISTYEREIQQSLQAAETLRERITSISATVDSLTTEQIHERLRQVDDHVDTLSRQVEGLQQIISPQNASEILNVARMNQEILAREALEKQVSKSLDQSQTSIQAMESKLSTLQYWIWGAFITLIGGLLGSVLYLAKLLSSHLIAQGGEKANQNEEAA